MYMLVPVSRDTTCGFHVLTELMPGPQLQAAVVPTVTYGEPASWVPQGYPSASAT